MPRRKMLVVNVGVVVVGEMIVRLSGRIIVGLVVDCILMHALLPPASCEK